MWDIIAIFFLGAGTFCLSQISPMNILAVMSFILAVLGALCLAIGRTPGWKLRLKNEEGKGDNLTWKQKMLIELGVLAGIVVAMAAFAFFIHWLFITYPNSSGLL